MSARFFETLIKGLCLMHKLDVDHVLAGRAVEMGGVQFSFAHVTDSEGSADSGSPLLTMYCEFGVVPRHLEGQVYAKLLQANLSACTDHGETYCLSSDGRVILANSYLLDVLTPELLTGFMTMTAALANHWRKGYFLEQGKARGTRQQAGLNVNKA